MTLSFRQNARNTSPNKTSTSPVTLIDVPLFHENRSKIRCIWIVNGDKRSDVYPILQGDQGSSVS